MVDSRPASKGFVRVASECPWPAPIRRLAAYRAAAHSAGDGHRCGPGPLSGGPGARGAAVWGFGGRGAAPGRPEPLYGATEPTGAALGEPPSRPSREPASRRAAPAGPAAVGSGRAWVESWAYPTRPDRNPNGSGLFSLCSCYRCLNACTGPCRAGWTGAEGQRVGSHDGSMVPAPEPPHCALTGRVSGGRGEALAPISAAGRRRGPGPGGGRARRRRGGDEGVRGRGGVFPPAGGRPSRGDQPAGQVPLGRKGGLCIRPPVPAVSRRPRGASSLPARKNVP